MKIDDYVKHVFREHNQEADHWANLVAEGQRKVIVDRSNNTESRKAVKGFWDASSKNTGRSGYGVVIKGVDKDKRVTISKVAVFLGVGTAMAAEVMGVYVLTEIFGLVFNKCLSIQNTNQCIDTSSQKSVMW